MNKVIITVIGRDKPGIIASVSETLFEQNCNIENISQTILQTEFAGIYIITMPEGLSFSTLEKKLKHTLADQDLYVHLTPLDESHNAFRGNSAESFIVTTSGPDRKGLVAMISRIIADAGANISNLTAVFEGGDNPDKNIMIYEIDIPDATDMQSFSSSLKEKASELQLELTIQHKNIFDAVNRI